MMIRNPATMNDWDITRLFIVIFVAEITFLGTLAWDHLGIPIDVIRAASAIVCVTFLPGVIVLRILRLHKLRWIEALLFSIATSVALVMLLGLIANSVFPSVGIRRPISLSVIVPAQTTLMVVLCALAYLRDREYANPSFIHLNRSFLRWSLVSLMLLIWTVIGTIQFNYYGTNLTTLFVLLAMAGLALLSGGRKSTPTFAFPLCLLSLSTSLLLHNSLITPYLWGWDIQNEKFLSTLVLQNSRWNPSLPYNVNGMLSVVILAPVLALESGMDLVWVFKILYPLLFALVPLGIFRLLQTWMDERTAYLSCLYFIFVSTFYTEMLQLARQEIAELFIVVILLVAFNRNLRGFTGSFLLILFGFSVIVSHYGLSYIFMAALLCVWTYLHLTSWGERRSSFRQYNNSFSGRFALLFGLLVFLWYTCVSSGSSFVTVLDFLSRIWSGLFYDLFNPETSQALALMLTEVSEPLHVISKYINLMTQILIVVGFVGFMIKRRFAGFETSYTSFCGFAVGILFVSIAVPFFASGLNATRIFQISLIFLSPFFVIGWRVLAELIARASRVQWRQQHGGSWPLTLASAFLALFLLFNTGFIYQVAGQHPESVSLNQSFDYPRFNARETAGASWIMHVNGGQVVYGDAYRWLLLGSFDWDESECLRGDLSHMSADNIIFLGTLNILEGKVRVVTHQGALSVYDYVDSSTMLKERDLLYDNGGSQAWR